MISKTFVAHNEYAHDAALDLDKEVNEFIFKQRADGNVWMAFGGVSITVSVVSEFCLYVLAQTLWLTVTIPTEVAYSFFYPENNEQVNLMQAWRSKDDAIAWWRTNRSWWQEIKAGDTEEGAWINKQSGDIIVLRAIPRKA